MQSIFDTIRNRDEPKDGETLIFLTPKFSIKKNICLKFHNRPRSLADLHIF